MGIQSCFVNIMTRKNILISIFSRWGSLDGKVRRFKSKYLNPPNFKMFFLFNIETIIDQPYLNFLMVPVFKGESARGLHQHQFFSAHPGDHPGTGARHSSPKSTPITSPTPTPPTQRHQHQYNHHHYHPNRFFTICKPSNEGF